MRRALLILFALCLCLNQQAAAVDLSTIDRTIRKLPALQTEKPEYCLLAFGPGAKKLVWLIHDGDVLYVDRNGNGDLTETDERIAADPDFGDPKNGIYEFKVGNTVAGNLTHKHLLVGTADLSFQSGRDAKIRALLEANPRWRAHRISIEMETPGQRGPTFNGYVSELAGVRDSNGPLQFSSRPEEAPIIHFGGPWGITFYDKDDCHIGTLESLYLAVGTPGLGAGTTAFVEYQGVVPIANNPTVEVAYPTKDSAKPQVVKSYELDKRCCGINLYGNIEIPADAEIGTATVTLSIPNWPGTAVASTTHPLRIVAPLPKLKLEPVSGRLKGSLRHVNKDKSEQSCIVEIQFSPDGQHLIAGDYPGGVVEKWNFATGKSALTLKMGPGGPRDYQYFVVSPDWKQLFAPTIDEDRKYEKIEKDGEKFIRWSFADSVQVFDLENGKLLREWQHSPPRGIGYLQLIPDGKYFVTSDSLSGDYSKSYARAQTLWNSETGEHRDILEHADNIPLLSPDGKSAVASFNTTGKRPETVECLRIFDFPAFTERVRIPFAEKTKSASLVGFVAEGKQFLGITNDVENQWTLRLWDATSGRELRSFPSQIKNERLAGWQSPFSPDGQRVAITNSPDWEKSSNLHGGLYLLDLKAGQLDRVDLGEGSIPLTSVFHPSGKWVVVGVGIIPRELRSDPDPKFTDLPQPRVDVIEVQTGKIVESLRAPQCFLNSMAFSRDGNTLATSGPGEVLLWDFSNLPTTTP